MAELKIWIFGVFLPSSPEGMPQSLLLAPREAGEQGVPSSWRGIRDGEYLVSSSSRFEENRKRGVPCSWCLEACGECHVHLSSRLRERKSASFPVHLAPFPVHDAAERAGNDASSSLCRT